MMTSSRDDWERLVAAVIKRKEIWELCHQQSRTPSICSTVTTSDDLSQRISSFSGSDLEPFSVPPSPGLPFDNSSNFQDAAISLAVQRLGDARIKKMKFLKGFEEHVRYLKDELLNMQCFLKDAEEGKLGQDERIREWIRHVREVAMDVEDVIDIFNLKVNIQRNRGLLTRYFYLPFHVYRRNRDVGQLIEDIRYKIKYCRDYSTKNLLFATSGRDNDSAQE